MNALPIVHRELRVTSRKSWVYWVRSLFALAGIIAVLMMFYEGPRGPARGVPMLWMLSVVTMILALFAGGLLTADSVSSEKRADTLGLLFLTNLKGYDVVTGKISTHAVNTACGILAMFPVFFLPILAGGVSWAETLRVLLGITVAFVFALTLGVWISTRSHDARKAVLVTLSALGLLVALPLLWLAVLEEFFRIRPSFVGVPQLSPGMLLFFARDFSYFTSQGNALFWTSIFLFAGGAGFFACLASRALPNVWQQDDKKPPGAPAAKRRRFFWRAKASVPEARRGFRFHSPNPFLDLLIGRFREFTWGRRFRRLVSLFFIGMVLLSFGDGEEEAFVLAVMTFFAMHAAVKFVFAFDATRTLHEDKRSSALELLLVTPLGERAIADGQSAAFRHQFRRHVRRLFVFTLVLQFTALANDQLRLRGDDLFLLSSVFWGAMIWTWSDYRAMPWHGMLYALKHSSHLRATLQTFGWNLLVPWVPYFLVLMVMAESRADEEVVGVVTLAWAFGGAIYQNVRAAGKRARLVRDFRMLVANPEAA